jgi:alcohol dehydrogenase class IV
MRFEFATATRILFGAGAWREVAPAATAMGNRALVVIGGGERAAALLDQLKQQGLETVTFCVMGEPTIEKVLAGVQLARQSGSDLVIGFGGGSVIDAGKAVAALLTNGGAPLDYLEVIGNGKPLTQPAAPYIAVPTTAGTGSEVTRNAVLGSAECRVKVSLRSPLLLPRLAVVDPELTWSLPQAVTASTGMDAFTQLIEPFVSNSANPLTDAICIEGLPRVARALRRAYFNGQDAAAREEMSLASLFGGMALANAKLGAVHGLASPLGGMFPAPHGAICARLLPCVMEANVRALQSRVPQSPTLGRYRQVARLITGKTDATEAEGVEWVRAMCADLCVAPLSRFGVTEADFPAVVAQAQKAGSMKGNPIPLSDQELTDILKQALVEP